MTRRVVSTLLGSVMALGVLLASIACTPDASRSEEVGTTALPPLGVSTLVKNLQNPWDVQPIGRHQYLVTERDRARLSLVTPQRRRTVRFPSNSVWVAGETGLMSLAIDPRFATNRRFYACHGGRTGSGHDVRVTAWTLSRDNRRAKPAGVLLPGLPSTSGRHGGCRLLIDDERSLWVGTGDAADEANPRDLTSLGGKTLRLDPATGSPWPTNPFITAADRKQQYVVTFGHRNIQGLAQRADGSIWSAEHGSYRDDEVNLIVPGGDYGWEPKPGYDETVPMTDQSLPGEQIEARWSSGDSTIATSGAAWVPTGAGWGTLSGTLAVAALKGSRVIFLRFDDAGRLVSLQSPPQLRAYGRLRSVTFTADATMLLTTANGSEDRVLRVRPTR